MPKGSDNPFPSALFLEGTTPASPPASNQRLFVRASDHLLCLVNSSGVVTQVGGGLINPMTTKGDVILGDTAGAPTRLEAGTSGFVLTSNGAAAFPSWQASASSTLAAKAYNRTNTTNYTTTSASYVDIDATNLGATLTTGAHRVLVLLSAWLTKGSGGQYLQVDIDGTAYVLYNGATNLPDLLTVNWMSPVLSAASHTIKLKWATDAGTATLRTAGINDQLAFAVLEQPF